MNVMNQGESTTDEEMTGNLFTAPQSHAGGFLFNPHLNVFKDCMEGW